MAREYQDIAASQTDVDIGAGGTQSGQHLSHIIIFPATTSPGAVTLKDGGGNAKAIFPGGADSVSNLVPFTVFLGHDSRAGAFTVTTGANVSVRIVGDFN